MLKKGALPKCFLIGGQKCGSTTMARHLNDHMDIHVPNMKELYYYSHNCCYKMGVQWYRKHFKPNAYNVDASANYFEMAVAPGRIVKDVPNAKIVLLLRNPVDRAYSQYQMSRRLGYESFSFEQALELEEKRLDLGALLFQEHEHNYCYQRLGYFSKGMYANLLKPWVEHFSREQIFIVESEQLFMDQEEICSGLFEFLELSAPKRISDYAEKKSSYPPMLSSTRSKLVSRFSDQNEELFTLLNRRFSWS